MATLATRVELMDRGVDESPKGQSPNCFDCSNGMRHVGDCPSCYGTSYAAKPVNE